MSSPQLTQSGNSLQETTDEVSSTRVVTVIQAPTADGTLIIHISDEGMRLSAHGEKGGYKSVSMTYNDWAAKLSLIGNSL